jgi:hypothetical protein
MADLNTPTCERHTYQDQVAFKTWGSQAKGEEEGAQAKGEGEGEKKIEAKIILY